MNCNFLVLLLIGLADKDSNRDSFGEHISRVLKGISKFCNLPLDTDKFKPPYPQEKYVRSSDECDDDNSLETYGRNNQLQQELSRRNEILINQFSQMPVITGARDLELILKNNGMSNMMVKVPATAVLNLISSKQLSSLYQNNQAFEVPVNDPSEPRLIAMTARVLNSLIRGKKRLHNVIGHGVAGAENLFSGIHEMAGGVAEVIGGGAHGLLDLVG